MTDPFPETIKKVILMVDRIRTWIRDPDLAGQMDYPPYIRHPMNLVRFLLILTLSLYWMPGSSQWIGDERIDSSRVKPWKPSTMEAYEQVYKFGEGETRSYLILLHAGYEWHAQVKFLISDPYGNLKPKYINFDSVEVKWEHWGHFYSDRTDGDFIQVSTDSIDRKGLRVERYWHGPLHGDDHEIGLRSHSLREHYEGDHTRASRFILEKEELRGMSKRELRIMRNGIYARYGYDFRDGGEMERYFSQKDWYEVHYQEVKEFLTPVEERNIELIKELEKEK